MKFRIVCTQNKLITAHGEVCNTGGSIWLIWLFTILLRQYVIATCVSNIINRLPASFTASESASLDLDGWVSSVSFTDEGTGFFLRMLSIENGLASIVPILSMWPILRERLCSCFSSWPKRLHESVHTHFWDTRGFVILASLIRVNLRAAVSANVIKLWNDDIDKCSQKLSQMPAVDNLSPL